MCIGILVLTLLGMNVRRGADGVGRLRREMLKGRRSIRRMRRWGGRGRLGEGWLGGIQKCGCGHACNRASFLFWYEMLCLRGYQNYEVSICSVCCFSV